MISCDLTANHVTPDQVLVSGGIQRQRPRVTYVLSYRLVILCTCSCMYSCT